MISDVGELYSHKRKIIYRRAERLQRARTRANASIHGAGEAAASNYRRGVRCPRPRSRRRMATCAPHRIEAHEGAACDAARPAPMAAARGSGYHRAVSVPPRPAPPAPEGQPMSPVAVALPVAEYPSSDGKPMAETPVHHDVMIDAIQILKRRFASRSDAYASGDVLMYYEEGNPRNSWRRTCSWCWGRTGTRIATCTCCGVSRKRRTSCWRPRRKAREEAIGSPSTPSTNRWGWRSTSCSIRGRST